MLILNITTRIAYTDESKLNKVFNKQRLVAK